MTDYDDERADDEEKRVRADAEMEGQAHTLELSVDLSADSLDATVFAFGSRDTLNKHKITRAIGAMLNAEGTLQTVCDCASVPGTLQRQARRDARALSEAIELLRGA